jgi:hypothetical protein
MNSTCLEVRGIKFFNNASTCISHFEKSHWLDRVISLITSYVTLFNYVLEKIALVWNRVENQMNSLSEISSENQSKKKLIICIHGLNNNPSQFKKIYEELKQKDLTDTAIYIPKVLEKGNAKLDKMAQAIFTEIQKWANQSGDKELVLVGVSNGGRISRQIETLIAKAENQMNVKKLNFISIVGACKGSALVNLANRLGLSFLMSKNISEEMPTQSERNLRLDQDWKNGLNSKIERSYTFIASPHDWQVTNYDSSLMEVQNSSKANYAIIPGHGHNSIVNAIAGVVAEIACI